MCNPEGMALVPNCTKQNRQNISAGAQVDTKYATSRPDDGMVNRVACLPAYWTEFAAKKKYEAGKCSPEMCLPDHCLFFSFMLDNRHVMDNV